MRRLIISKFIKCHVCLQKAAEAHRVAMNSVEASSEQQLIALARVMCSYRRPIMLAVHVVCVSKH